MTRTEQKQAYRAAREAAQIAVGTNRFPETADGMRVHVETWANVQLTEDGAFVEATIWVPKSRA